MEQIAKGIKHGVYSLKNAYAIIFGKRTKKEYVFQGARIIDGIMRPLRSALHAPIPGNMLKVVMFAPIDARITWFGSTKIMNVALAPISGSGSSRTINVLTAVMMGNPSTGI